MSSAMEMASLPPLPDLSSDLRGSHGFSPKAHWVIPGALMQGERPAPDAVHGIATRAKCRTFVNLQSECVPEEGSIVLDDGGVQDWRRTPAAMAPYGDEVVRAYAREGGGPPPSFLYYGIRDMKVAKSLDGLVVVVAALVRRIRSGEAIYLHCWGGKGRSGLVASCLLVELYGIDADAALRYVDGFIQLRNADGGGKRYSSPETYGQILQVKEYKKKVRPEDESLAKAVEYLRVRAPLCFCFGGEKIIANY
ncbi:hypothetical protein ACHAWF_007699 [Thalassiosira exigua]